jgi:hypothetical protein
MDTYHVALYGHFLALMWGITTTTLMHLFMYRAERATTVGELGGWARLLPRTAKMFPGVLALFFLSGAFMVSKTWNWQQPFVEIGTLAVVLLLVNGIIMGTRMRRLPAALAGTKPSDAVPAAATALLHDPIVSTLPWVNGFLVLGVAFVMTTKPALPAALAAIAVAIAAGFVLAYRMNAHRSEAASPATERA